MVAVGGAAHFAVCGRLMERGSFFGHFLSSMNDSIRFLRLMHE
jgi:hypothetical protein